MATKTLRQEMTRIVCDELCDRRIVCTKQCRYKKKTAVSSILKVVGSMVDSLRIDTENSEDSDEDLERYNYHNYVLDTVKDRFGIK